MSQASAFALYSIWRHQSCCDLNNTRHVAIFSKQILVEIKIYITPWNEWFVFVFFLYPFWIKYDPSGSWSYYTHHFLIALYDVMVWLIQIIAEEVLTVPQKIHEHFMMVSDGDINSV